MKLVLLIAVPAAIGLIVLAEPLVATIFYGGVFTGDDVRMTALALQAFAVGLIGFSYVKILAPAYFAREDTRTPVRVGLIALAVNFVLSVSLAWYLTRIGFAGTHAGLALAISVAALLNAFLLYRGLRRDGVVRHGKGWTSLLLRTAVANLVMTAVLVFLQRTADFRLRQN
jgi:putative peptidoglycan lipid II flippase